MGNINSRKVINYEKILQKAMLVLVYDYLKEQIQIIEQTRVVEKKEAIINGEINDRVDKVSQRSMSIELKGKGNPNWLNNIFSKYKDIKLSNFLRLVGLIQSKYEALLMLDDFSLENLISEKSFELSNLINEFVIEFYNTDFSFDEFLSDYGEEVTGMLYDCLEKLVNSTYLTNSDLLVTNEILRYLDSDYSEREQTDNIRSV